MTSPLSGVQVIELGGIGPGPFCGMLLADLGAEVIRVERVSAVTDTAAQQARYEVLNRGKASLAVDLRHPAGRDVVMDLIAKSDMAFEGFRPGVAERLGLGPQDCHERNPRLIYGRMTGWGQAGPLSDSAGHDVNYIGLTGALDAIGEAGRKPVVPLNLLGDFGGGGVFLALGMVSALWESARSGRGQVVDAAIVDGTASLMGMLLGMRGAGEWAGGRGENSLDGGAPYYDTYECSDGRWLSVGSIEPKFYAALLEGLGLSGTLTLDRYNRIEWARLKGALAARFLTKTRDEWCTQFAHLDACVSPVLSIDEAAGHPHNHDRQYLVEFDGVLQPGPAPRFDRTPSLGARPVPHPGEHTQAILVQLGLSDTAIDTMYSTGIVA